MPDLKRLQRWGNSLAGCIRCGYCYEHCPIFKSTRWETDAPRAKLTLLFGLLNREVEPSDYLAEKLFECFSCKRCESACSSGVPVTDIFTDARADLLDAGFEVVGTTSVTDHDKCARCLNCVRMCKHEARWFDGERVVTDRLKCQSCGNCLDVCSAGAILIQKGYGTNPDEQREQLTAFLQQPQAKAVVFACTWSNHPGFQAAQMSGNHDPEHTVLYTACSGRLRTRLVLDALGAGAWGVLVTRCPEDDCEHGGSARTQARVDALQAWLEQSGIDPRRLQIQEVPKGDPAAQTAAVNAFLEDIRGLGPLRGEARR
jgi:coenzyme F420-reducing hydrogenase delta subunit/NAD-dependent dihydropyrimidine dehydrogenase PreA subunit